MSAREAKNPATQRFGKIDDLLKVNTNIETDVNGNVDIKVEVNDEVNGNVDKDTDVNVENNDNKLAALKEKMKKSAKRVRKGDMRMETEVGGV